MKPPLTSTSLYRFFLLWEYEYDAYIVIRVYTAKYNFDNFIQNFTQRKLFWKFEYERDRKGVKWEVMTHVYQMISCLIFIIYVLSKSICPSVFLVSVCLLVWLSVRLLVWLSVRLSGVCLSASLAVCPSFWCLSVCLLYAWLLL